MAKVVHSQAWAEAAEASEEEAWAEAWADWAEV